MIRIVVLFWVFFSLGNLSVYALQTLSLNDDLDVQNISSHLEFVEDPKKTITIDRIAGKSDGWHSHVRQYINFGYTKSRYWFRFRIESTLKIYSHWFLELDFPGIDSVELYVPRTGGKFRVKRGGDQVSSFEKEIHDRTLLFPIVASQGIQTYFFVVDTTGPTAFSLNLMTPAGYHNKYRRELPVHWFYFSLMAVMILYNLLVFLSVRDTRYIYFLIFLMFWTIFEFISRGFAFQYLWPNATWWANQAIPLFMALLLVWSNMFWIKVMDIKSNAPGLYQFWLYGIIVPMTIVTLFSLFGRFEDSMKLVHIYTAIGCLNFYVITLYMAIAKKQRVARFLLFASTLYIGSDIGSILTFMGVLPFTSGTRLILQICSCFSAVLFSFILSDRIIGLKNSLSKLTLGLKGKIDERTSELHNATQELEFVNRSLISERDAQWGEMQIAQKIQTVLLTHNPHIPKYEIATLMEPTESIGGDYYDIIHARSMSWIGIGDVSGYGVPAGLVMMMVQSSLRVLLQREPDISPSDLLVAINDALYDTVKKLGEDRYMTLTVLALEEDGRICYSGLHQDLMIFRARDQDVQVVETDGFWIGVVPSLKQMVRDDSVILEKGDTMLLFTNGVTGACDDQGMLFGNNQLLTFLREKGGNPVEQIKEQLLKKLEPYSRKDDITFVILKRMQ